MSEHPILLHPSQLLHLLLFIRSQQGLSLEDLAERFSLSSEAILYSLNELNQAGIPVYFTPNGCRVLPALSQALSPFTAGEVYCLDAGLSVLVEQNFMDEAKARQIRSKILALSAQDKPLMQLQSVKWSPSPLRTVINAGIFQELNRCVVDRQRIHMQYQSRESAAPAWRELSPYCVVYRKNSWYTIGYCHKHGELRTFKVTRIQALKPSMEEFQDDPEFDLDEYLLYSWNIMSGEPHLVIVRFDRAVGSLILEKEVANGRVWKEKGFVYLKTLVSGLEEFSYWLMQYGEHAEVLQPVELRKILARRCAKMLDKYKGEFLRKSERATSCRNISR